MVEDLKELYEEFEQEVLSHRKTGSKAEKIRMFVLNLSDYLGKTKLCYEATYDLACTRIVCGAPLSKSYFKNIVSREWTIEIEDDIEWIRVDLPRRRR